MKTPRKLRPWNGTFRGITGKPSILYGAEWTGVGSALQTSGVQKTGRTNRPIGTQAGKAWLSGRRFAHERPTPSPKLGRSRHVLLIPTPISGWGGT